jgi:hypothetical protein
VCVSTVQSVDSGLRIRKGATGAEPAGVVGHKFSVGLVVEIPFRYWFGSAGAGEFPASRDTTRAKGLYYYHYYFCFLMYIWNVVVSVIGSSWRCPKVGLVMDR